jgi:hypothetical protein
MAHPSSGRSRNAVTRSSISAQSRLTWLFDTPLMPSALTRSSTERVDTPWMQASWITAVSAFSAIRRGSRKPGKYDPRRSLGMRSSTVPARVSQSRSR